MSQPQTAHTRNEQKVVCKVSWAEFEFVSLDTLQVISKIIFTDNFVTGAKKMDG